jgi:hypothetical protein
MESQKHTTRFDTRYDTYAALWRHKPMKELGFECDFVKLGKGADGKELERVPQEVQQPVEQPAKGSGHGSSQGNT